MSSEVGLDMTSSLMVNELGNREATSNGALNWNPERNPRYRTPREASMDTKVL